MKTKFILSLITALFFFNASQSSAQTENIEVTPDKLVVLWTSDDPYVAEKVAFMYTHAAKRAGWFSEVTLIVWGPSQKLTVENLKIQKKLKAMQDDGIVIQACISCANSYGIAEELKKLGIEVKGMGKPLTHYLKSGAKVLTF
ncbi:MAG: DsrE family protein [Bacteroidales bacterium]|jgi:hypothetical protein|nr:DsrE family protein [Bacteroidales bacterium]